MAPLHYLNAIRSTGCHAELQKTSGVFFFLVQANFFCWSSKKDDKGLAGEFCNFIVFYQVFESPQLRNMLQAISMTQPHCSFN